MREQIRSFYIRSQRLLDRLAGPHGLTARQMAFLLYISENTDVRHIDLVNAFRISPGAGTDTIDELESAGHIARLTHRTDRRIKVLKLTSSGQNTLSALTPIRQLAQARLFGVLTASEEGQLQAILEKLNHRLTELELDPMEFADRNPPS
jgi:DNA-binding MarR family transcriptional regulator